MLFLGRSSAGRRRNESGGACALLVYHRVGTSQSDPLRLNVTPAHLEQQLAVISNAWSPISLVDLADSLRESGAPPPGSVAVTFDDGYQGVLSHALQLLERYEVPATAFVVSGFVGGEVWWEALDSLVRGSRSSPAALDLEIGGRRVRWNKRLRLARRASTPDDELFYALCRRLSDATPAERARALGELESWSGGGGGELEPDRRPLSADGLRRLSASGIVEIGAHSATHPVLAHLNPAEQAVEIEGARTALEELVGCPVTSFAYPYGGRREYNASATELVRRAGYRRACTNVQAPVRAGANLFELPRLIVGDWDSVAFERVLEQWLGPPATSSVPRPA